MSLRGLDNCKAVEILKMAMQTNGEIAGYITVKMDRPRIRHNKSETRVNREKLVTSIATLSPGIVSGEALDNRNLELSSTEVKSSMERIFIPGRANPVKLYPTTDAYKLLTHVRDEAHRFAISYHRKLRDKKSLKSEE